MSGDSVSIPQKMQWRIRELKNILKQTIILEPTTNVNVLKGGQQIRVDLPPNSLVDLSTFLMSFTAWCDTGASPAGGETAYTQCRFLPRNTASLIENLEVQINGQSRFNCPNYNYIYNILHDYSQGQDGLNRRGIGENADPSCKYFNQDVDINGNAVADHLCVKKGYPLGIYDAGVDPTASQNDLDTYVVRSWLGIFQGSTQVIDTSMLGLVTIIITLAPSAVTMLGTVNDVNVPAMVADGTAAVPTIDATNANAMTAYVPRIENDSGINIIAGGAALGGVRAEVGKDYHLKELKFSIVRYDMPSSYYQGVSNNLNSGASYKLYFPNYSVFTGQPIASQRKSGTVRFSISTKSLDYVIGTFRAANHDNNNNATNKVVLSSTSRPFSGAFGEDKLTFDNQVRSGKPVIFNNSKYLVRNGESLTEATWFVGNTRLLTEKPTEIFDGVLRHFNIQNDVLGGLHPSIKCLQQFNKYSFAHILSLNVSGETDMFTVSGLDSQETPVNVGWEFKSNADFTDDDTWGLVEAGQTCIPTLIACYSSHIEINAQRNIISVN